MRKTIPATLLALTAFCLPVMAYGAVVINEIAWMGTAISASDEWIELHNRGTESVSLDGWKLTAEDGAPSISLAGSIDAGGFYLLERTDDTTVPDQPADKIYTGDLANGGETLTLLNSEGVAADTVIGGADWKDVGGNNTTKDTPQRQADDTWLTGVPTPRALNTTVAVETGEVKGASTSSGGSASSTKKPPTGGYKQNVFAYAGEDITIAAGADAFFEGFSVDGNNKRLAASSYVWIFGDGDHGKGKEIRHTYQEPGKYSVVLTVRSNHQKHTDKLIVTANPTQVSITATTPGARGYIEVHNASNTELDMSAWRFSIDREGKHERPQSFEIPANTIILPGASVRFIGTITGLDLERGDTVRLRYPSGKSAAPRVVVGEVGEE